MPVPFRVLSGKQLWQELVVCLELVPLRGENKLEPRPQNKILVPFTWVGFKISDDHPDTFYMGVPPLPCSRVSVTVIAIRSRNQMSAEPSRRVTSVINVMRGSCFSHVLAVLKWLNCSFSCLHLRYLRSWDHLRSNLEIICGLGIICGAVQHSSNFKLLQLSLRVVESSFDPLVWPEVTIVAFITRHTILECEYAPKRVQIWGRITWVLFLLIARYGKHC